MINYNKGKNPVLMKTFEKLLEKSPESLIIIKKIHKHTKINEKTFIRKRRCLKKQEEN